MNVWILVLESVAVVHTVLALGFTIVCIVATLVVSVSSRRADRRFGTDALVALPPVLLLRPAENVDVGDGDRWASDSVAYSGACTRVVCLPELPSGPRPDSRALGTIVASGIAPDAPVNRKMAHLAAGLAHAEVAGLVTADTVVVHADADVVLGPGDLDDLIRALRRESSSAMAFAAPRPTGRLAWLARQVLALSPHAFSVLFALARVTGGPPPVAGKLVAVRADVLAALGGYGRFASDIADDLALVEAVHGAGHGIEASVRSVRVDGRDRSLRSFLDQLTRWIRVASSHRKGLRLLYPTFVAPLGVSTLLVGTLAVAAPFAAGTDVAFGSLAGLVLARTILALTVALAHHGPDERRSLLGAPFLAFAGDWVVTVAALRAGVRAPIRWSGRDYEVERGGRITGCKVVPGG